MLLATTLVAGGVLFVWLDLSGHRVHPVNIGNSPFLPLWLFALAGAAWGSFFAGDASGKRLFRLGVGLLGTLIAVVLVIRYGTEALFTKPFGRSDATRLVPAALFGSNGAPLNLAYYNLRPVLAAACIGLQLAALALLGALLRGMTEKASRVVFALGRHALGAYVLHLALLAVIVVAFGRQPLSAITGAGVLTGLVVTCQAWSLLLVKKKNLRFTH
jgi:hypothetical protein